MKFNPRLLFLCCTLGALFLSSCGPTPTPTLFSVELVSPRTSTVLWPQSVYLLAAQAYAPSTESPSQPVHITFTANGQTIGAVDSTTGTEAILKWTPPSVGQYAIQASAQSGSNLALTKTVQMCILKIDTTQGFRLWGYGYNGPCALPAPSTSDAPINVSPTAKPAGLSYSFNCPLGNAPTVINFEVKVSDPGNRVAFVNIKYGSQDYTFKTPTVLDGATETSMFDSVMLNQTSVAADGTKVFTGSTEDLGPLSAALLAGGSSKIQWSVRALKSDGVGVKQLLVEDGPYTTPIGPCTAPAP